MVCGGDEQRCWTGWAQPGGALCGHHLCAHTCVIASRVNLSSSPPSSAPPGRAGRLRPCESPGRRRLQGLGLYLSQRWKPRGQSTAAHSGSAGWGREHRPGLRARLTVSLHPWPSAPAGGRPRPLAETQPLGGGEGRGRTEAPVPPQPDIAELHVPRAPAPGQPDSGERFRVPDAALTAAGPAGLAPASARGQDSAGLC